MSRLLLDVGNSRAKWRIESMFQEDIGGMFRTGDILCEIEKLPLRSYTVRVAVVSWVGPADLKLEVDTVFDKARIDRIYATGRDEYEGLVNGYLEPFRLGADRWVGLYYAWKKYAKNCIIVDVGTAVTIDHLAENGRHLGGVILPGVTTMVQSLNSRTSQIHVDAIMAPGRQGIPGRTTTEAVTRGAVLAVSGAIKESYQMGPLRDLEVLRVITGGGAPYVLPLLGDGWRHEPDLLLDGLSLYGRSLGY